MAVPPYQVIATDMDGTLLRPDHKVSAHTKETLHRLVAKYPHQVFVVLASGRHVLDLASILESLQLPEYCGYIVSLNGSRAHKIAIDRHEDGSVSKRHMEQVFGHSVGCDDVRRLLQLLPDGEDEINVNVFQRDSWLCTLDWRDELQYFTTGFKYDLFDRNELVAAYDAYRERHPADAADNAAKRDGDDDPDPENPLGGVGKLFFGTDNIERLMALRDRVDREFPSITITFSSKYCMELTAAGVSKESGLAHLVPRLQCHAEAAAKNNSNKDNSSGVSERWVLSKCCIAFGDGENDEVMLRSVAKGCLMSNSSPRLKEKLPDLEVIKANAEDGVAQKLSEVFNL